MVWPGWAGAHRCEQGGLSTLQIKHMVAVPWEEPGPGPGGEAQRHRGTEAVGRWQRGWRKTRPAYCTRKPEANPNPLLIYSVIKVIFQISGTGIDCSISGTAPARALGKAMEFDSLHYTPGAILLQV